MAIRETVTHTKFHETTRAGDPVGFRQLRLALGYLACFNLARVKYPLLLITLLALLALSIVDMNLPHLVLVNSVR